MKLASIILVAFMTIISLQSFANVIETEQEILWKSESSFEAQYLYDHLGFTEVVQQNSEGVIIKEKTYTDDTGSLSIDCKIINDLKVQSENNSQCIFKVNKLAPKTPVSLIENKQDKVMALLTAEDVIIDLFPKIMTETIEHAGTYIKELSSKDYNMDFSCMAGLAQPEVNGCALIIYRP